METVGFIGLGRMGSAMAGNVLKAGYPLVVHDVRDEAAKALAVQGATLADSPAEVARVSDVTFTSLPGPQEVERVIAGVSGILEGVKEGDVHLDLSTCGPELVKRLEPMYRAKGAHLLDAPVLSTPDWAAAGVVTVAVGGELETFHRICPVLDAFADKVIYAGRLGSGCVCKLVNNMMEFCVSHVIAEGLTLGVKAGVELQVLLESGSRGMLGSRIPGLARTVFKGKFDSPSFTLALFRKDIGLATGLGRQYVVPTAVADLMEQSVMQGMNKGWENKDWPITFLLQEERAGVEVRLAPGEELPAFDGDRGIA